MFILEAGDPFFWGESEFTMGEFGKVTLNLSPTANLVSVRKGVDQELIRDICIYSLKDYGYLLWSFFIYDVIQF